MKNLTIRTSLMASLLLFSVMFGTGAALGIFTVQRSNEALSLVHKMSSETQAINDVYKDTARTRLAMLNAYTETKESGTAPSVTTTLGHTRRST